MLWLACIFFVVDPPNRILIESKTISNAACCENDVMTNTTALLAVRQLMTAATDKDDDRRFSSVVVKNRCTPTVTCLLNRWRGCNGKGDAEVWVRRDLPLLQRDSDAS
ncbi:uncharacterized protein DS421_1g07030 [Arachis hypogaea]|nr:uncharacterized protein DS421_1g07030 [Arachis hypogaea]